MRLSRCALAGISAMGLIGFAALGTPAWATSSATTVSLSSSAPAGGRTLVLKDAQGNPLSSLDVSGGTSSFVASVVDSNYSNNGYSVSATMSNLYGYNPSTGTWNCSAKVPSSALSLSSPSGLLAVSGVSTGLTPVFSLSGTLTSILSGLLPSAVITNQPVQGNAQSLTQGQVAGGNTGSLFGSTLASVLGGLPVKVTTAAGGSFSVPAADPVGSNCNQSSGAGATSIPIMNGTANPTGLIGDLVNLVSTATASSAPTAAQLISGGFLTSTSVINMVCTTLNINCSLLTSTQITSIENALTDNLSTAPPTLLSGLTGQSGTYSAQPGVAINTTGIPAGTYHGTLTVTLVDS